MANATYIDAIPQIEYGNPGFAIRVLIKASPPIIKCIKFANAMVYYKYLQLHLFWTFSLAWQKQNKVLLKFVSAATRVVTFPV
jgi:hypothetical protein